MNAIEKAFVQPTAEYKTAEMPRHDYLKSAAEQAAKMTKDVEKFLKNKYGAIQPEWKPVLTMLLHSLTRYFQVKSTIDAEGIINDMNVKSPLLSTEKDLCATIFKLSQKLGISPWDASKIKNSDEDDTEDYIDALTQ